MLTKIYGIYGRTTAVVNIPTGKGKAQINVTFDRGVPNPGPNYRPATFSTSDPVVQEIMENCSLFNKMYTLYRVYGKTTGGSNEKSDNGPVESTPVSLEPMDGIETIEEAIAYLKSKGAKATQLRGNEAIKKYAEKIGVSFPKLNL